MYVRTYDYQLGGMVTCSSSCLLSAGYDVEHIASKNHTLHRCFSTLSSHSLVIGAFVHQVSMMCCFEQTAVLTTILQYVPCVRFFNKSELWQNFIFQFLSNVYLL